MELLIVIGAALFGFYALTTYGKATADSLTASPTRHESNKKADHLDVVLLIILLLGALALGGAFTTGLSMEHFVSNMNYINSGTR